MAPAQRRGHAVYRQQPRRVLLETFEDADGAIRAQPDEISRFDLHSSSSGVTMIGSSTIESRPLSLPASATPIREKLFVPSGVLLRVDQIGRASCRERVCQYVWFSAGPGSLKKKKQN